MTSAPLPSRYSFEGGNLAIDLVNTVDWTGDILHDERLLDYAGLVRWAEEGGVLEPTDARKLVQRARKDPAAAAQAYRDTRELRRLLQQMFLGYIQDRDPPSALLARFNALVQQSLEHRTLRTIHRDGTSGCLRWEWEGMGADLYSPWWPVVNAASALLTSNEAARLKVCASPTCGWMFIDTSRNGMRRWCAMDGSCGARAKARRHYARVRRERDG